MPARAARKIFATSAASPGPAGRGPGPRKASIASRSRSVSSFAAAMVGFAASTAIGSPTTSRIRGKPTRRRPSALPEPSMRMGTSGAPVRSASFAAPRCQMSVSRTTPSGKMPTSQPSRRSAAKVAIASRSPRPRSTGNPPIASTPAPTAWKRHSSILARNRTGRLVTRPSRNGSSTDSWFDARIAPPEGTGRPTTSNRYSSRASVRTTACTDRYRPRRRSAPARRPRAPPSGRPAAWGRAIRVASAARWRGRRPGSWCAPPPPRQCEPGRPRRARPTAAHPGPRGTERRARRARLPGVGR